MLEYSQHFASRWGKTVVYTTLVCSVASLCMGLLWLRPDRMLVEQVVFQGNLRAENGALRHLADIRNGVQMWNVDLARASRGVRGHPWVRDAHARREWPNRVIIEVDEYVPAAVVLSDALTYVDERGTAFMTATSDDLDYPVISGLNSNLLDAHPDLPRLVVKDALALMDALESLDLLYREQVSEVRFSDTAGFLVVVSNGAQIRFGLERRASQVVRLEELVSHGESLFASVLIDLASDSVAIVQPLAESDGVSDAN